VGYLRVQGVDAGSLNVGLQYGVLFEPRVQLEASVDYHTPKYDDYNRATYAFEASLYVYPFTAKHRFRPYAVGGVGYYWSYYDANGSILLTEDNRSDAGFHAGFGFDLYQGSGSAPNDPSPKVHLINCLTFDLRYLFTQNDPGGTQSEGLLATIGIKTSY
jgi:hypothetical protein